MPGEPYRWIFSPGTGATVGQVLSLGSSTVTTSRAWAPRKIVSGWSSAIISTAATDEADARATAATTTNEPRTDPAYRARYSRPARRSPGVAVDGCRTSLP